MSTLRRLLVVVLALVALAPGLAGQSPVATQSAIPKLEFEKSTLPNGLQVILHVDRKLPIVHVNQWFHVGSKNEKRGRTGFAHLFEHMMFQGSKNASASTSSMQRRPARTSPKVASTAPRATTAPTTSRRCRRGTSRTCCGSSPIGWLPCSTPPTSRSSTSSATSSRTNGGRDSRTSRTDAGSPCCSRTCSTTATRTRGRPSAAWRTCQRPRSTTSRTSSVSTTRPTTCRWSSRATSTPRKPRSSSRSTSATCPWGAARPAGQERGDTRGRARGRGRRSSLARARLFRVAGA